MWCGSEVLSSVSKVVPKKIFFTAGLDVRKESLPVPHISPRMWRLGVRTVDRKLS